MPFRPAKNKLKLLFWLRDFEIVGPEIFDQHHTRVAVYTPTPHRHPNSSTSSPHPTTPVSVSEPPQLRRVPCALHNLRFMIMIKRTIWVLFAVMAAAHAVCDDWTGNRRRTCAGGGEFEMSVRGMMLGTHCQLC